MAPCLRCEPLTFKGQEEVAERVGVLLISFRIVAFGVFLDGSLDDIDGSLGEEIT
jgi:hypothetical protein